MLLAIIRDETRHCLVDQPRQHQYGDNDKQGLKQISSTLLEKTLQIAA